MKQSIKFFSALIFIFSFTERAIARDLKDLAQSVRQMRNQASNFEAFSSQTQTNSDIKEDLLQRALSDSQGLCNDLALLDITDLIELIDIIDYTEPLAEQLQFCLDSLGEKIDKFYKNQQRRSTGFSRDRFENPRIFSSRPWGPSRKVTLNDQSGGLSLPQDQRLPQKWVALTFDDGPHPTLTPQLLEILREEQVQVTFFWIGRTLTARPQIVRDANALGHLIGGHTQTHPNLASRTHASALSEINQGMQSIRSVLGFFDPIFRFPYGARTNALRAHLRSEGITDFFWDVDTRDWQIKDSNQLLQNALTQTRNRQGGIVLFHDIQRQTIAMMRRYIQTLKAEGYTPVIYHPSSGGR